MDAQLFIDDIYECAFVPGRWEHVLTRLADYAGGVGGFLMSFDPAVGIVSGVCSPQFQEPLRAYIGGGVIKGDSRASRMWAANYGGFLSEADVFGPGELEADETFKAFYKPRGIGRAMITALFPPLGDTLFLGVERSYEDGPTRPADVQRMNELRPHLARAALISQRFQQAQARAAAEALGLIGLPALVFGRGGRVLAANEQIQQLTDRIHWLAADRIVFIDLSADRMLRQAMARLDRDDMSAPASFALRGVDAQAAMVAHLVPVRGSARDILVRCTGVLVLMPIARPDAPPVELIQSLFDLTPSEARVARGLTTGSTLEEIADANGLSRNTIRSQLRGALEKTGSRRQAELVALLGGIVPRLK